MCIEKKNGMKGLLASSMYTDLELAMISQRFGVKLISRNILTRFWLECWLEVKTLPKHTIAVTE